MLMTNKQKQAAEQLRRAIQLIAASLPEEQAMEIATVYEPWKPGKAYKGGEYVSFGVNAVGDPQLYRVIDGMAHTAQKEWTPDVTASLYVPVGLDNAGYPVWSAPTGAHDAYNVGDVVNYTGMLYQSLIDGNTVVPGTDDRYWTKYGGDGA